MNKEKFTRAGFEPAASGLMRHVNPEVAGSNPALAKLFMWLKNTLTDCKYLQRPTLLYDGLHDRALKHYFRNNEVKKHLAQMNPRTSQDERESKVRWGQETLVYVGQQMKRQLNVSIFCLVISYNVFMHSKWNSFCGPVSPQQNAFNLLCRFFLIGKMLISTCQNRISL